MPITHELVSTVTEADLPYEEDVSRNQHSLKAWLRYLEYKSDATRRVRFMLYERAIAALPFSYKLWKSYLHERVVAVRARFIGDKAFEVTNQTFERCLVYLFKMPVIWFMYTDFLILQKKITLTRKTFDRALQCLPITQHDRVWAKYLPWVRKINVPETAVKVHKRYLKLEKDDIEDYIEYLLDAGMMTDAASALASVVHDRSFTSKLGKSRYQFWLQLCELLCNNPSAAKDFDVEAIIRQGLARFVDQVGKLWTCLANYYIRLGNFEKARDVFEEALTQVVTVRDFAHIWEGYTQFEDGLITTYMEQKQEDEENGIEEHEEDETDFELRVARYEYLIDRRPLLLSSVMLRQNPHNVHEWLKRAKLYTNPKSVIDTFTRALKTVDPIQATGRYQSLWISFARYYEDHDEVNSARQIYEKAVQATYRTVEDLASVWCAYAEMECRQMEYERAREVLRRGTKPPSRLKKLTGGEPVQERVYKSTRLWCFYADIEESVGTFESTKAVYETILELRIATPNIIINYAHYLEENRYFEESFKAYERGVSMFNFPYSLDIWLCYLTKFAARYGGTKLERTRDLFEQALETVPANLAQCLYIMYADAEEKYGRARNAMRIYDRATQKVPDEEKFMMFNLYISRATEFFGVTRTREIYEKAVALVPDKHVKNLCIQYANMERKLGEIDRARAIYTHASQYCDPRVEIAFWKTWYDFEVRHGNEDTFREMLRVKRTVQAQYNTQVNFNQAQMVGHGRANLMVTKRKRDDDMSALERAAERDKTDSAPAPVLINPLADQGAPRVMKFTPATGEISKTSAMPPGAATDNTEEIDIDDDSDDDSGPAMRAPTTTTTTTTTDAANIQVEQLSVPSAVFGSVKEGDGQDKPMGALERLRKRK